MKTSEAIKVLDQILGWNTSGNDSQTEQALTHAIEFMKAHQWRDIESAPRDGTDILVYCSDTQEMFAAFFATQVETGQQDWVIARAKDGTCFVLKSPTYWMPLPDAPKED